jgi:hypothetical protein
MTAAYVALMVVMPLVALYIVYLAGWRDEWFVSSRDKKDG